MLKQERKTIIEPKSKKKIRTKLILVIVLSVIVILIITNPTNKLYTEYLKANMFVLEPYSRDGYDEDLKPNWGIRYNYIIFTTFKYNDGLHNYYYNSQSEKYSGSIFYRNHIGILSNFYELAPTAKNFN
jgi:hypothetical protein